jgi:hypothetical protein
MDSKDDDKICYDWFLCFRKDKPAKPLKKPAAKRGPNKKV